MPKYIPTIEELEKEHKCFICGRSFWGEGIICDDWFCKQELEWFDEYRWFTEDVYHGNYGVNP